MQFIMDPQQHLPPPPHPQAQPQAPPPPPPPSQVVHSLQLPVLTHPSLQQQQHQHQHQHQQQPPPAAAMGPASSSPQIQQFGQVANPTPNLVSVPVTNNHPPYAQVSVSKPFWIFCGSWFGNCGIEVCVCVFVCLCR